jgi:branched-chain amino acid transport system substrate-binding protein
MGILVHPKGTGDEMKAFPFHHAPRLIKVILMALAVLTGLTAQASESPPAAAEASPIRIGATVSLEGKYEQPSLMARDSLKLWESQINKAGGLLGRPVQLILYDDKSNANLVGSLYEKLISEDKVDLVLPPYGTPLTLAATEVTERHGFVMLACTASGNEIWSRGYKRVFGVYAPASRYFIGLLDIMARKGLGTVALLYENTPFSKDLAEGCKEWAGRFGLKVSFSKSFVSAGKDLAGLLKEAMAVNPDGLIVACYPDDTYFLLDLMQKLKYRPGVLAFSIAPALPDFAVKAGAMAENVFGASQWEPDERLPFPGTRKFIREFKDFTGKLPSYHAGSTFAGCEILERAVSHCHCLDQKKIADFIRSLDTVTVIGRFKVDPDGMQTGHNSIIIQWQNGRKEIVFPSNMETAAPRL